MEIFALRRVRKRSEFDFATKTRQQPPRASNHHGPLPPPSPSTLFQTYAAELPLAFPSLRSPAVYTTPECSQPCVTTGDRLALALSPTSAMDDPTSFDRRSKGKNRSRASSLFV